MSGAIYDAAVIFLSVFVGLTLLWSVVRVMTLPQRVLYTAVAGGLSAGLTLAVLSTVPS